MLWNVMRDKRYLRTGEEPAYTYSDDIGILDIIDRVENAGAGSEICL